VPCSLLTTEQVSRHTAVEKRALVGYLSRDTAVEKQRIDLSASDYDHREERISLSGRDGALTGECGSEAAEHWTVQ